MSTFTRIDHSEKQRRQILEAIDLFREKDTRDELGIAGIRDTFSDILFSGTGSLQTRARYFFFVPWMYLRFEEETNGAGLGSIGRVGVNRASVHYCTDGSALAKNGAGDASPGAAGVLA